MSAFAIVQSVQWINKGRMQLFTSEVSAEAVQLLQAEAAVHAEDGNEYARGITVALRWLTSAGPAPKIYGVSREFATSTAYRTRMDELASLRRRADAGDTDAARELPLAQAAHAAAMRTASAFSAASAGMRRAQAESNRP